MQSENMDIRAKNLRDGSISRGVSLTARISPHKATGLELPSRHHTQLPRVVVRLSRPYGRQRCLRRDC